MRHLTLIAGACLCVLSTAAQAAPSEAAIRWFQSFDQDKDGVMTAEEYTAVAEKQFGRVDSNSDGAIDLDEYVFGIPEGNDEELERAKKRFLIMDKNGDGSAAPEEYAQFGIDVIELSDGNGDQDGKMTIEEFTAQVSPSE